MHVEHLLLSELLPVLREKTEIMIDRRGDFDVPINVSFEDEPLASALLKISPKGVAITLQFKGESTYVESASYYGRADSDVERLEIIPAPPETDINESQLLDDHMPIVEDISGAALSY